MTDQKRTEEYIARIRVKQPEMVLVDYVRSKRTLAYLERVMSALERHETYKGTW